MTSLTLEQANSTLAAAGIRLRMSQNGLATLSGNERFQKAMQHCVKNPKARQDVLSYLDHLRNESQELVYRENQPQQAPAPAQQQPPSQPSPAPQTPDQASTEDDEADDSEQKPIYVGHHVYGGKAALEFKLCHTRAGDPTISIDGAPANGRNSYNWKQKTILQITMNDLPSVAAVFFGLTRMVELRHYGANNDKSIKLEHQGNVIFIQMSATDFAIQVPVSPGDAFQVRNMILRQLLAKHPELGVEGNLASLKCHGMMLKAQGKQQR